MYTNSQKQQGSFFAEISATIAAISILTLIGTNYVNSQAGRAQVSEAFVLMQPLVEQVNNFHAKHGMLGDGVNDANYDGIIVHTKTGDTGITYAGRYVQEVQSYPNGVVRATMNTQFLDSDVTHDLVGKISNV